MNVKVIRKRVLWIQFEDRIECSQNFIGPRVRLTRRRPLVPRAQVHHCFREKRAGVWIFWKRLPHLAHRVRVRAIERAAIFRLRISVTFCEGIDQRSLNRRGVPRILLSALKFLPCKLRSGRWNGGRINVGPARER